MPPRKKNQGGLTENKNRTNIIGGKAAQATKKGKTTVDKNVVDKENLKEGTNTTADVQPNLRADIQSFQLLLNQLSNSTSVLNKDQIIRVGNQLHGLTLWNTEQITPQDRSDCETILSLIGSLLEKDVEASQHDRPQLIVSSKTFCLAVLALIKQYPDSTDGNHNCLFQTHYSYELSLYILLSLVEKTAIASIFIENLTSSEVLEFLKSLSHAIPKDVFYLTQEMAVEAICRICFFLTSNKKDILKSLENNRDEILETELKTIILSGKAAIVKLLKEMRPYLTKINKSNPNIQSFPLLELNHSTFREDNTDSKKDSSKTTIWLDICQSYLCIFVVELDIFIRLKYEQVSLSVSDIKNQTIFTLGVPQGFLPKRLEEVVEIPLVNQAGDNKQQLVEELELKFQSNKDATSAFQIIAMRCKGEPIDKQMINAVLSMTEQPTTQPLQHLQPQQRTKPAPPRQQEVTSTTVEEEVIVETMMEEMIIVDKLQHETEEEQQEGPPRYGIATTKAFHLSPQKTVVPPLYEVAPVEQPEVHSVNDAGAEADIEVEREANLPPHIPSVVSITATENIISDLSEENEEDSYDRQRVREAKRLSASKVDSLTALFVHHEPPRTTQKKAEEKAKKEDQRISNIQQGRKNVATTSSATKPLGRSTSPFTSSKKAAPRMKLTTTTTTTPSSVRQQYDHDDGAHFDTNDWHDDFGSFRVDQPSVGLASVNKSGSVAGASGSKRKFGKKKESETAPATVIKKITSLQNPLSPFSPNQPPHILKSPMNLDYSDQMEIPESALDGYKFDEYYGDDDIISAPPVGMEKLTNKKKTPSAKKSSTSLDQQNKDQGKEQEIAQSWDPKWDNESTSTSRSKRKFGRKTTTTAPVSTVAHQATLATLANLSAQKENIQTAQEKKKTVLATKAEVPLVPKKPTATKEKPLPKPKMSLASHVEEEKAHEMEPLHVKPNETKRVGQSKKSKEWEEDETSEFQEDEKKQMSGPTDKKTSTTGGKGRGKGKETIPAKPAVSAVKQKQEYIPPKSATPPLTQNEHDAFEAEEHRDVEENISWERDLIEVERSFKISPQQEKKQQQQQLHGQITSPTREETSRPTQFIPRSPIPVMDKLQEHEQPSKSENMRAEQNEEQEASTITESTTGQKKKPQTRGLKSTKAQPPAETTSAQPGITTRAATVLEQTTTTHRIMTTTTKRLETVSELAKEDEDMEMEEVVAEGEEHITPADVTDFETTTHVKYSRRKETESPSITTPIPASKPVSARKNQLQEKEKEKPKGGQLGRKRTRRGETIEEEQFGEVDSLDMSLEERSLEEEYEDYHHPSKKSSRAKQIDSYTEFEFGGSGSNDEESVYTMLINEIVALNKERAARRKSRIVEGMYNNVLEQVTEFIQNSFENLSKAMSESELQSILLKLEQQVVPLINQIMEFIEEYEGKRSVRDEHFTVAMKDLTKDYAEFESLANNYLTDREKESQQLREEIVKKRKSCQEHCSREVRSIYQTNANKLPRIGLAKDVAELLR